MIDAAVHTAPSLGSEACVCCTCCEHVINSADQRHSMRLIYNLSVHDRMHLDALFRRFDGLSSIK